MEIDERLARIETHVEYIREAIDKSPELCAHHREPIEGDLELVKKRMRLIGYLIVAIFFLTLGLLGHETGAVKAVIALCSAG